MTISVISLVVLAVVVAVGFIKKVNLGFFAMGAAFVLGLAGGMSASEIADGFNSSMFVTLVGVTFLFGMASNNGTLDLFSKKVVALVGRHTVFIPILMFVLSAFISAIGPGHIAAGVLMTTFAMYLAFEMKINPMATALYAKLGANAGCASILSMTGILAKSLSEPMGYSGFSLHLFLTTLLSGFVFTLVVYMGYKGYKVKADNPMKLSEIPKFNRDQLLTIAAIIVMVVCCIGFKLDTGLFAFAAAGVLVLLGAVDEKKAIKTIPWGTLILICGMGVLVNVIHTLGGITLISDFLTSFMSEGTATPILAATSGILSWVSSTTGVVMPTMYPIAASVCETFGSGVSYVELISAITATSFAAAISPLSTGGAIIMSSYSAARETTTEEMNRMFRTLFLLSVGNVFINVVMAALGVFNLGGLFY
ncbi:MAG TPA: C4-dicarboxylate ABC transporter [Candidatus Lachnoclostridium stercoripullorum]|uniref:C4-dicarboxylate ABC transporter n=1 Tax=Candidatus Lachnoclostridium stercoripullorum TaxID=2838635 RepID=A0A9D2AWW3_9FIRM|nr:C4-dicarboxylate ABC transporter [Candidatus Lachnoclostridium stercoripullorum]